jgi:hypothetical protein
MHAKMGCEVLRELGLKDAPTETEYYKLLIAKMYEIDNGIPEKEVEVPIGILDNTISSRIKEVVEEDNNLGSVAIVQTQTPAIKKLSSDFIKKNPLKFKKKQVGADGSEEEVEVSVDFPYLSSVDYSGTCQSLKISGGLLAPCLTRRPKGQNFCKACTKLGNPHGTIQDREKVSLLCYKSDKGKTELAYGTYITKRGLDIEVVKAKVMEMYNVELPNEYWSVDKVKASRAVKTVSTSSDDEVSVENASTEKSIAKKRGRPKKAVISSAAEETPAEETPAEETPAEETPAEETPAEETPAEETPAEETPAEETPAEETPAEETPAEETPAAKETPKKGTSKTKKGASKKGNATKTINIDFDDLKEVPVEVESDGELEEESVSSNEIEAVSASSMKNGIVKKLDNGNFLINWDNKTYVVDSDDNTVWNHDESYEIMDNVGEWEPESKRVEFDDE